MLDVSEGRIATAVIEDGAEGLVIPLVEAEKSDLQVVLLVIGGEAGLASSVSGVAVLSSGDGDIRGLAAVVAAVVVVKGRDSGEEVRIEGVEPGKEQAGVGLVFAVSEADAGGLRAEAVGGDRSVLH